MTTKTRSIVGIGCSAGSLEALLALLGALPDDHGATLLVVPHRARSSDSMLESILEHRLALPILQASDGLVAEPGTVHVAPPDRHLLYASDGTLRVTRGPRENSSRPAIDPTFRSLAINANSRAVGIVLTGMLSDGASGLASIRRCGGAAIAQDPGEALYPDMPRAAIGAVPDAEVLPLAAIAQRIVELARTPAGPPVEVPEAIVLEGRIAEKGGASMEIEDRLGERSNLTCPHCRGVLWRMNDDNVLRFRCHTGHAYTADDVYDQQTDRVEEALWSAMRAHRERAEVARKLATGSRGKTAELWLDRAADAEEQAELIRSVLVGRPTTEAAE